jgi:hypothetical protein
MIYLWHLFAAAPCSVSSVLVLIIYKKVEKLYYTKSIRKALLYQSHAQGKGTCIQLKIFTFLWFLQIAIEGTIESI